MKATPNRLIYFLSSVVGLVIFTSVNNAVYNWVFLFKIQPVDQPWTFVRLEYFVNYWNWPYGRLLCVLNLLFIILPFVLWRFLSRSH